jgi:thiamine-phosphate pyrophosphorylase
MSKASRLRGLYAITDRQLCGGRLLESVSAAIAGGARIIQYRDKSGDSERRQAEATALCQLCREHDALFIINDEVELALQVDADGVHIGQSDSRLAQARQQLGPDKLIGVSCNNRLEYALTAQQQGADYVAFGRFFPSTTKPDAPQADLSLLETAREQLTIPIVAIGGITPETAGRLVHAGADMLAVIHGVFGQANVEAAARHLNEIFTH